MIISEKDLHNAGFSERDVENLKSRVSHGGGTMDALISALSRRFRVSVWVTVGLILVMLCVLLAGNRTHIVSGGVSAVIALVIVWATFPPSLGMKARRLEKFISRRDR
ncbi:hypothetical protein C5952_23320 [Cronobacter sakazakii]|jgi:hypothetical protein|uniref:hypothetical protein n=1 Tax=Cronobacter TaxID=413496 RepID=UPI000A19449D|nr:MULTISPECIES: hypothetical protein [Cronobacter]EGT4357299.1 hypothetical protein [Cronobacter sakazakii]EKK3986607.1 hypothetical protein [Cronobacter sakazakii]EKK5222545.1 hypothetical protein [Cronobacter sakazakii]ELY2477826.1 hypothetical protein [Cronobacter sakazakii]ELY2490485.1 hypothetical protein [Cronobacter sakazakii]